MDFLNNAVLESLYSENTFLFNCCSFLILYITFALILPIFVISSCAACKDWKENDSTELNTIGKHPSTKKIDVIDDNS